MRLTGRRSRQAFRLFSLLFITLTFALLSFASALSAQEGYKGTSNSTSGSSSTVFKRPIKKVNATTRSALSRSSAKAVEANSRGDAHYDAGRYEEAIEAYKQALTLNPKYVAAQVSLGDAYQQLGRNEEAVVAYKQALKLKPNDADASSGLGDTYSAMGMKEKADEANNRAKSSYVAGGVMTGKATSLPKPPYPPAARAAHVSGAVIVQVVIDESGQVIRAEAVSGHPLLRVAAVTAASLARFSPTKLSGQPVKVIGTITYNFNAQ